MLAGHTATEGGEKRGRMKMWLGCFVPLEASYLTHLGKGQNLPASAPKSPLLHLLLAPLASGRGQDGKAREDVSSACKS